MKKKTALPWTNKKIFYNYEILKEWEAGLVLKGFEVKAIINGAFDITNAFIFIDNNFEAFLNNFLLTIPKTVTNVKLRTNYKLLLNKKEIHTLKLKKEQIQGTIVPVSLYFKNNKIKLKIALARGKKRYQKKQALIEKDLIKKNKKIIGNNFKT